MEPSTAPPSIGLRTLSMESQTTGSGCYITTWQTLVEEPPACLKPFLPPPRGCLCCDSGEKREKERGVGHQLPPLPSCSPQEILKRKFSLHPSFLFHHQETAMCGNLGQEGKPQGRVVEREARARQAVGGKGKSITHWGGGTA